MLGWLIGQARTMTGLVLQIVINVGNMALTVLFVSGLERGIAGAATANALAEWIGAAVGLIVVMASLGWRFAVPWAVILDRARPHPDLRHQPRYYDPHGGAARLARLLHPPGAVGGDTVLAANAILMNFVGIVAFFLDGFATSAEQLGGQAGGRAGRGELPPCGLALLDLGDHLRHRRLGRVLRRRRRGHRLRLDLEAVRAEAKRYLPYMALTPFTGVMAFLFDGVFIGATWAVAMRNCMLASLATFIAAWWLLSGFAMTGCGSPNLILQAVRGLYLGLAMPGLMRLTFR